MPQEPKSETDGDEIEEEGAIAAKQKEGLVAEQEQAWHDIISAGATLLGKLSQTLLTGKSETGAKPAKTSSGPKIEIDETTGQQHLKIPMPNKETIQGIVNLLNDLSKKL